MERMESTSGILNIMIQPAFIVKDGIIDQVNEAARGYFLESGTSVSDLLVTGKPEYQTFKEGCLYLTLSLSGGQCGASVHRMKDFDLFTIEDAADDEQLQVMALAARELRSPLSNVMTIADQLFPVAEEDDNPAVKEQVSRINRGLFQMLRIVSNMSDAYRYQQQTEPHMAVQNVTEIAAEVFEQAASLLGHGGIELKFTNLENPLLCLVNREMLERAIHNLLSNAAKFSEKGSCIYTKLSRNNGMLYLSVEDSAASTFEELQGNVHSRFRRQPCLEDSRFGIGLGMVLIRATAASHGGTVLIDHPNGSGTRVTMSLAIRQNAETVVRSNIMHVDYAGERSHPLVELSDVLPTSVYSSENIN